MDGTHLSLRFKHGLHTILLFVDPLQPVSAMTALLLDVLRERYPDGELTSTQGTMQIPPAGDDVELAYGRMRDPGDPAEGWTRLEVKPSDTPARKGIRDGEALAFAVAREDGAAEFVVDWPRVDEYDDEGDDTIEPA